MKKCYLVVCTAVFICPQMRLLFEERSSFLVKIYLSVFSTVLPDTARKSRQKTRVVKRTTNPVFNHTMVCDGFRSEDLREACVELTVWDHDRLSNHFIGGTRLGLGTGGTYSHQTLLQIDS